MKIRAGVFGSMFFLAAYSTTAQTPIPNAIVTLPIPDAIKTPEGAKVILTAKTKGGSVQVYECKADERDASHTSWNLKGPDATLMDATGKEIIRHSFGPAWTSIADGSKVTGKVAAPYRGPDATAVPWLLLGAASHDGDGMMNGVQWIQRVNTRDGMPPAAPENALPTHPCESGAIVKVGYSATYIFSGPDKGYVPQL